MTSLLENLFEGPGAANGISWVRLHHADKLDDISLVDWLYGIKDTAASGAYRASPGEKHTVGEERGVPFLLARGIIVAAVKSIPVHHAYPITFHGC